MTKLNKTIQQKLGVKMTTQIIYLKHEITKSKIDIKKLILFLSNICNTISFSINLNYYDLSISEYSNALHDYDNYYKNEDKLRRNQFYNEEQYRKSLLDIYSSSDEVILYLDRLKEYDMCEFNQLKKELQSRLNNVITTSYKNSSSKEKIKYISTKFTVGTHCTIGGLYKEYKYKLDYDMLNILLATEDLFESFCFNPDMFLEDPGFYIDDRIVCSICSHENTITLFLIDEEYKVFNSLAIPYNV